MIRPRFLSALTMALCLASPAAFAGKLDEWYKILPKNTLGVIAIKDVPELLSDWDKSSFSKLMQDEDFQKWTAPMRKDGETPWDKFFKEVSGEGMHESLSRYPGAMLVVVTGDSPEDFSGEQPPLFALSDATGREKELEEMKIKEMEIQKEEDDSLKERTLDVSGVTVHVLADSEEAEEGWKASYAFVEGTLVETASLEAASYLINALKSGSGEGSETVTNHLTRLEALTEGRTDVLVYINGEPLVQWGIDAAKAAAAGNAQMPIDPNAIIEALGVTELQSLAFMLELTDEQSRLDFALLHPENPQGLVSLLRGTGGEVNPPAFVPADVLSSTVNRYSIAETWDKLLAMINKLGPMAAIATMQLGGAEAQAGVSIRDDLLGSLADEYVDMGEGRVESQSQVLAFKIKDRQRLGGAVDGIKRFAGSGFAAFDESEYLGYQISAIKSANAQPGSTEVAFCVTDDYLLISTGPQALLKKVLSRMKEPASPGIWEDERVIRLLGLLPQGYLGVGVADGGKMMMVVVDAMKTVQDQAAKKGKKSKSKAKKSKGPKTAAEPDLEDNDSADEWFDPNATPPEAMWKRYFGTSVSGYYNPADAVYYRSVAIPVEAD